MRGGLFVCFRAPVADDPVFGRGWRVVCGACALGAHTFVISHVSYVFFGGAIDFLFRIDARTYVVRVSVGCPFVRGKSR